MSYWENSQTYIDEVKEFIKDCVYAVEANSFETLTLWQRHHEKVKWEQINSGFGPTVGFIGERPVCVSINVNIINGHRVLFYNACSQLVDHVMVEAWVKERIGHRRMTDAMNFHQVIHYIDNLNNKEEK